MPHKDRKSTIGLVFEAAPEIPAWPQLTSYPAEQMMAQYIEGLPGLVNEEGRLFVDSGAPEFDRQMLLFYEEYLAIENASLKLDDSSFKMGEKTGATFRVFLDALGKANLPLRALKGQIAGPFTLLSSLKDREGRALIYDERFLDIIPKLLGVKAAWQIELMKPFGLPVIIFLDEPGLAGFGSSSLIAISAELALRVLADVVDAVHSAGAMAGVHVCANTDWMLAFDSKFDIINFDSYGYFDKFALYREPWLKFVGEGGNTAWGVVPTLDSDAIRSETAETLARRWTGQVRQLAADAMEIEQIIAGSLFTPACGCGSLTTDLAQRVLDLLGGFCRIVRS
jgi:hypothetical protein